MKQILLIVFLFSTGQEQENQNKTINDRIHGLKYTIELKSGKN